MTKNFRLLIHISLLISSFYCFCRRHYFNLTFSTWVIFFSHFLFVFDIAFLLVLVIIAIIIKGVLGRGKLAQTRVLTTKTVLEEYFSPTNI